MQGQSQGTEGLKGAGATEHCMHVLVPRAQGTPAAALGVYCGEAPRGLSGEVPRCLFGEAAGCLAASLVFGQTCCSSCRSWLVSQAEPWIFRSQPLQGVTRRDGLMLGEL